MNVKCPNCRFKFDAPTDNANPGEEITCTCQRCGRQFPVVVEVPEAVVPEPAAQPQVQSPIPAPVTNVTSPKPIYPAEHAVYQEACEALHQWRLDDARELVNQLMATNPNVPQYRALQEQFLRAEAEFYKEQAHRQQLELQNQAMQQQQQQQPQVQIQKKSAAQNAADVFTTIWNVVKAIAAILIFIFFMRMCN